MPSIQGGHGKGGTAAPTPGPGPHAGLPVAFLSSFKLPLPALALEVSPELQRPRKCPIFFFAASWRGCHHRASADPSFGANWPAGAPLPASWVQVPAQITQPFRASASSSAVETVLGGWRGFCELSWGSCWHGARHRVHTQHVTAVTVTAVVILVPESQTRPAEHPASKGYRVAQGHSIWLLLPIFTSRSTPTYLDAYPHLVLSWAGPLNRCLNASCPEWCPLTTRKKGVPGKCAPEHSPPQRPVVGTKREPSVSNATPSCCFENLAPETAEVAHLRKSFCCQNWAKRQPSSKGTNCPGLSPASTRAQIKATPPRTDRHGASTSLGSPLAWMSPVLPHAGGRVLGPHWGQKSPVGHAGQQWPRASLPGLWLQLPYIFGTVARRIDFTNHCGLLYPKHRPFSDGSWER